MLERNNSEILADLMHSSSTANECKVNANANELTCFEVKINYK